MAGTDLASALEASLLAGFAATSLGALPVVAVTRLSRRASSALSGFAAGVMLAAAFVSLLLPSFELAGSRWPEARLLGAAVPVLGLLAGAGVLGLLDAEAPHAHFVKGEEGRGVRRLRRTTLVVIAIAIHNFPEGFAVGAGVGAASVASAPIALGIALQNAPEGLVVATSLLQEGRSRGVALAIAALTGLVEPLGSALGWAATSLAAPALPAGLAFAAGAMLYVVSGEIIPESHRGEGARAATWGTMAGIGAMLALNAVTR